MTDINTTATVPNVSTTKAKVRHRPIARFIYQSHCPIDAPIKQSIERMSRRLRLSEADIHRMALINYLNTADPEFARDNRNA